MRTSYKDAVIYQIYPRSFCDSNGDGIGDIPGIIGKLDYLADLGVDYLWLSPVYKSPNDDNGYDISDYCSIHPDFGTMEDFDALVAGAKARGIGIIMDLVINHTSDEHEWFKRALAGEEKYRNYYIIRKGRDGDEPNNWGNFFAMNPWNVFGDPKNNEYYLHLFSKKQPDLNWHNPEVYDEVCGILRFWLERGELDMVFAFEHMETEQIGVKWFKTKFRPEKLMKCLTKWQTGLDWNATYFENHDQPRCVSRFGDEGAYRVRSAQMLGGLILSLRGTPFIYEGQEIGMTNGDFASLDEIMDIESHTVDAMMQSMHLPRAFRWSQIRRTSRDNARTPMQWSAGEGAGFTSGTPWLQINKNHTEINAEADMASEDGVRAFYKKMIALRKATPALLKGSFGELYARGSVYMFERVLGDERYVAAMNFSGREAKLPVASGTSVAISNYPEDTQADAPLRPWEFRLIAP